MSDVRVGVLRFAGDRRADSEHPADAELGQHWVAIGDEVLTAQDHGLIDVQYGVDEPGGLAIVTIRLYPSSFASVSAEADGTAVFDSLDSARRVLKP